MLKHIRSPRKISSLARHALHSSTAYFSLSPDDSAAARDVASLLKTPNWDKNTTLKSLVSHMSPHTASQVISLLHSSETHTSVRFFTWVCKHSSYCFSPTQKTHLLKLIVSSRLYRIAHSVTLALIREFNSREEDMLKLMRCFDETGFRLNYPCYSSLLMSLAKLDLGFLAYLTYRRMEADGFVAGEIDYRTVVNALCKNGNTEAAEMFVCKIVKVGFVLDSHVCTSLVLGFCRGLNLGEALRVFNVMSREEASKANSVTYSNLIHGLCEVGRLDEAFGFKDQMGERGCEPSTRTYTVLIKALCDKGLVCKAFGLFDEMVGKGCKGNVHTYTVLIDGLCRDGKVEEANGICRRMVEDGVYPSVVTYNALVNGYCKDGRIVQGFEVLAVMEKSGCRPNVRTFNELMGGLCRVGRPFKALHLLRRMVGDDGLLPDVVSYNVLIDGFCREGFMNVAYKLLSSMSSFDIEPDCVTFTAVIDALCKRGKVDVASALLSLMVRKGIRVDEVTCTALVDGFCKLGRTRDALFILETMSKMRLLTTPHSLNVLLDVLSKGCRVREELAVLGRINKLGLAPSVVTYTTLVDGLVRSGDVSGSLKMVEAMKSSGCLPNVYPYTIIINGLCRCGRLEEAEKLLYAMQGYGVSPNHVTYTVMVKGYVVNGKLDRALETVGVMVERGYELNERVYSSLVSSEKDCLDKLISMVEELGGSSTRGLYDFVVTRLCKEGRVDESKELIQTMLKRGVYVEKGIDSVIESYCGGKEHGKCVELIRLVLGTGFVPSFKAFCLVVQGLEKEGEDEQAGEMVMEVLRSSGVVEKSRMLEYVKCLMEGDEGGDCSEVIDQLHCRERPIF